jgi:HD-GYP domain-containing protein (c-di-GMP phosphodiesterase class II)
MARVLLLGPDRERAAGIRSLLRRDGHIVTWLRSVEGWREREREERPDVVVAPVGSPDEVVSRAPRVPATAGFPPPLLLVQQETDFPHEVHREDRLVDRLSSPFLGEELLSRVDALVRVRRIVLRQPPEERRGAGGQVWSWLRSRLPADEKPRGPYLEVAARLAEWSDRRDAFQPGHAERVSRFGAMIAEGLDLDEDETACVLRAAMLHDVGKVALPIEVLRQRQPLDESQVRLIRTHPARGAALLRALDPDEDVARAVLYHHERPDGTGYYGRPAGGVPRAALALAVAETYDAMTSSLLREPLSPQAALERLTESRGIQHDADCVDALADQLRPRTTFIPVSSGSSAFTKITP